MTNIEAKCCLCPDPKYIFEIAVSRKNVWECERRWVP